METVELVMTWRVFFGVAFAVVAGHAMYDLLWEVFAWAGRKIYRAGLAVRDLWIEREPVWPRVREWLYGPVDVQPVQWVPDVPEVIEPEPKEWPYLVSKNGTLHHRTCHIVRHGYGTTNMAPWTWAETPEEARQYAEEQELRPCGACHPLQQPVSL